MCYGNVHENIDAFATHFVDDNLKGIFLKENICVLTEISLKYTCVLNRWHPIILSNDQPVHLFTHWTWMI